MSLRILILLLALAGAVLICLVLQRGSSTSPVAEQVGASTSERATASELPPIASDPSRRTDILPKSGLRVEKLARSRDMLLFGVVMSSSGPIEGARVFECALCDVADKATYAAVVRETTELMGLEAGSSAALFSTDNSVLAWSSEGSTAYHVASRTRQLCMSDSGGAFCVTRGASSSGTLWVDGNDHLSALVWVDDLGPEPGSVRIQLTPTRRICAHTSDDLGNGVAGFEVSALQSTFSTERVHGMDSILGEPLAGVAWRTNFGATDSNGKCPYSVVPCDVPLTVTARKGSYSRKRRVVLSRFDVGDSIDFTVRRSGSLRGRLVRSDGTAITGAHVTFGPGDVKQYQTDSARDGAFRFDDLPTIIGNVGLGVLGSVPVPVRILPETEVDIGTLEVTEACPFNVEVLHDSAIRARQFKIHLFRNGSELVSEVIREDGWFFTTITPGPIQVVVTTERSIDLEEQLASVLASAPCVDLKVRVAMSSLRATIDNATRGEQVNLFLLKHAAAETQLVATTAGLPQQESVSAQGTTRIWTGLPPGQFDVVIVGQNGNSYFCPSVEIPPADFANLGCITLGHGRIEGGLRLMNSSVPVVRLRSPVLGERMESVAHDGLFEFDHVSAGPWLLEASYDGLRVVPPVACIVMVGKTTRSELAAPTGEVYGLVLQDSQPLRGVFVIARCGETGQVRSAMPNAAGKYILKDLAPGRYSLRVSESESGAEEIRERFVEVRGDTSLEVSFKCEGSVDKLRVVDDVIASEVIHMRVTDIDPESATFGETHIANRVGRGMFSIQPFLGRVLIRAHVWNNRLAGDLVSVVGMNPGTTTDVYFPEGTVDVTMEPRAEGPWPTVVMTAVSSISLSSLIGYPIRLFPIDRHDGALRYGFVPMGAHLRIGDLGTGRVKEITTTGKDTVTWP